MGERLKIGLVGYGSLSQRGILPHLALDDARELVELTAVCDAAAVRAEQAAARAGLSRCFTDLDELLSVADVDAVLIATPIPLHFEQAMAALRAGKHVYVQKTMTTTLAEADSVVAEARRRGLKLAASPGQMLSPAYQRIKQLVAEGNLGQVYWAFANTGWVGHEHESFRASNPVDPTWYYKAGGGPVYDMGVYALHALTGILGPVRRVTAMSAIGQSSRRWQDREIQVEMDDNTLLLLDLGASRLAMVGAQFCHFGRVISWGFMGLYGSAGSLEIPALEEATGYPAQVVLSGLGALKGQFGFADGVYTANAMPPNPLLNAAHLALPEAHVWADIRDFAEAVIHDREPVPSGEHARHVIEIIEKGYRAARSGQTQEVTSRF